MPTLLGHTEKRTTCPNGGSHAAEGAGKLQKKTEREQFIRRWCCGEKDSEGLQLRPFRVHGVSTSQVLVGSLITSSCFSPASTDYLITYCRHSFSSPGTPFMNTPE